MGKKAGVHKGYMLVLTNLVQSFTAHLTEAQLISSHMHVSIF